MGKVVDKLVGQKIVVVGGSSGIGFGAAAALLAVGAHVTIVSSSQAKVDDAVKRLQQVTVETAAGTGAEETAVASSAWPAAAAGGVPVQGIVANVRDEAGFTAALQRLAPVDHVVFSAVDRIIRGPLAEADLDEAQRLFGVKFWGSVIVGKALVSHDIVRSGGSLTLTSGAAALRPGRDAVIGAALNAAVINLTRSLASELARPEKRIRVNTVVPGLVQTELWDTLGHSKASQQTLFAAAADRLSVGFVATPADIAEAYLYTVRANYANGSVLLIDGGSSNVQ